MPSLLYLVVVLLLACRPAQAFPFAPADFGLVFDRQAEGRGSALRAGVGQCDTDVPQSCGYSIGALYVRVYGAAGTRDAVRIKLESGPSNGALELAEAEPIIVALCSASSDEAER